MTNESMNGRAARGTAPVSDVVVVGGGLAGLAGALTLVRARRSVVVVDAGRPRNAPAAHAHGYLTRDGVPPLELPRLGRAEIRGYGGAIVEGTVTSVERLPEGGFRVTAGDGTGWDARRVLVTTGLVDQLPDLPGLRERWGRDVVHCPYCFGWELRDQTIGVLGTDARAATQALMWRQWTEHVIFLVHTAPGPTDEQRQQLAAGGITVIDGEVGTIEVTDDTLRGVRLRSGQLVECGALAVGPRFEARHAVLAGLGATVAEHPLGIGSQVQADPTGRAAPGIWVAGNVADITAGVMQSAASGVTAAAAINADLVAADTADAVAASSSALASTRG